MRLAAIALAFVVGWTSAVHAAAADIASFVVKFRDDWRAAATDRTLPSAASDTIASALQREFTVIGRTRDGAFMIAFDPPLAVSDARASVNRVRQLAPVLYASIVAPSSPANGHRTAVASASPAIGTNQLIVKYRDPALVAAARSGPAPDQARIDRLSVIVGETVSFGRAMSGGAFVFRLSRQLAPAEAEAAAAHIALEPDVEYAQPDRILQATLTPNDALYGNQWDLFEAAGGINAPKAWNTTTGAGGGVMADIDTGFLDHPDLAGRFVSNGYDFIYDYLVANDGDPVQPGGCTNPLAAPCVSSRDANAHDPGDWITAAEDTSGYFAGCGTHNSTWHGTHTAGTMAAASNNAAGIAGINWVGKILPLRVLGKCGGYTSDIADAIVWASGGAVTGVPANPTPARVMNMSLGGFLGAGKSCPVNDTTMQNAINTALGNGSVVVVSAGNSNADAVNYTPASCNGVITVAATQRAGGRASYSNYGATVEIAAPGGGDGNGILSTLNCGTTTPLAYVGSGCEYAFYQGTSMAAPHVTGVVSLIVGLDPSLTPAQVLSKITSTARAFPSGTGAGGGDCTTLLCGAGILDAGSAIAAACPGCTSLARLLVPDGTSAQQTFAAYPESRWFALPVEPGKTYVVEVANVVGDLTANAVGSVGLYAADGTSAPAEASVDCTAANGPRPPAVDVSGDGIRCIVRTALPTTGMQQSKRPVYVKVTQMDPALGGGSQFKIRAREATVYGRWRTDSNYDYHIEVENTTADQMCVEVALYPASGLTYAAGPGWSAGVSPFTMTVPPFGAVKSIVAHGTLVGADSDGSLRIGSCGAPINFISAALHVSTYAFDPVANSYVYYFTSTANEGKTRSRW